MKITGIQVDKILEYARCSKMFPTDNNKQQKDDKKRAVKICKKKKGWRYSRVDESFLRELFFYFTKKKTAQIIFP